jgi:hypothetical protein
MGTSEPGKRPNPAVPVAVGETRAVGAGQAPAGSPVGKDKPRSGAEDTVPASGPGDGWPVAADPPDDDRTSGRIDRYVFGEELGRGGMGRVIEATDTRLGRKVAIKEALPRGLDLRRRFEREVRITARLEHPSIVPLYDAGLTAEGNPFYVMRKVSGRPLDKLIADARDLGERLTLLPHLLAAIDAVAHAHRRDVVHRDMKPANVLVGEHGETVVIDWGLAKALGEEDDDVDPTLAPSDAVETQIGAVFGTPGFMAPEQALGQALDPRSDVYALGATLYQLLSGRPPHSGNSATEVIDRALVERPPPLRDLVPGVPPELVTITDKALAYHREDRYADGGALAEDVRRFLAGQLVAAHRYTTRQRIGRTLRRHRAAFAVATLATVALAVGGVFSVRGIVTERDRAMRAEVRARDGQRAAEEARDREADRADEMLITQARALVETNPTVAIAALKKVAPTSKWLRHARIVAVGASARGTAWGYPGHGRSIGSLELAPDGKRLLSAGESNGMRIHDLESHAELLAVDFADRIMATWVSGGDEVLVAPSSGGLVVLDASTGTRRPISWIAGRRAIELATSAAGDNAYVVDDLGAIHQLVVRTGVVTPVAIEGKADSISVAPDGSWLMLGSRNELRVVRASDLAVLARANGQVSWNVMAAGSRRGGAVIDARAAIVDVDAAGRATLTMLDPPPGKVRPDYAGQILFRGDQPVISRIATGKVETLGVDGKLRELFRGRGPLMMGAEGRGGVLAFGDLKGNLVLTVAGEPREIRAPSEGMLKRVAADPDSRYVAIAVDDVILVWDLDRLLPTYQPIPDTQSLVFRDDDTMLITPLNEAWRLIDLRSGEVTKLHHDDSIGPMVLTRVLVGDDRRMLVDRLGTPPILIRPSSTMMEPISDGPVRGIALLTGGRFAYGTEAGALVFGTSLADRRIVMDGKDSVDVVVPAGDGAVVMTATDALVRFDGAGRETARIQLSEPATGAMAVDPDGQVLIGIRNRIASWNGARVEDVATLDAPIHAIYVGDRSGILASTGSGNTFAISPDGTTKRVLARTRVGWSIAQDGGLVLAMLGDGQLVVVDLVTNERAVLPAVGMQLSATISPDGRRVAFPSAGLRKLAVWNLDAPAESDPDAWVPWLEELTNARPSTASDVIWPWQDP